MANDDQSPAIGISPIPPHQGDQMTVTWTGAYPKTLTVEFTPGPAFSVVVTGAGGTQVDVPAGATSVVVSDPDPNGAAPETSVVAP